MIVIREQIKEEKNRPSRGKEICACFSVNRQNIDLKEVRFVFFYSTGNFLYCFEVVLQKRLDYLSVKSKNVLFPWVLFILDFLEFSSSVTVFILHLRKVGRLAGYYQLRSYLLLKYQKHA